MEKEKTLALRWRERWSGKGWGGWGMAVASFAAGALLTGYLTQARKGQADSNRVFELMVYHTVPGKAEALEALFRDVAKLQAKHGINVVGYWVPNEDAAWSDTFIYLVAHPSREDAKKNWHDLHADPAFPPYREAAIPMIQKAGEEFKVDEVYMRPTDYSALR